MNALKIIFVTVWRDWLDASSATVTVSPLALVSIDVIFADALTVSPGRIGFRNSMSCSPCTRRSKSACTSGSITAAIKAFHATVTANIGGATIPPGRFALK